MVGINTLDSVSFMLGLTLISKIVLPHSRGTMFSIFSFIGSLGVVLANLVGGQLFDHVSHLAPFIMMASFFAALILLTFVLGVMGKIKTKKE
jgi:MFS family permease